jgi:gamma-glutamyltranspeptidase/glutathione hydrolase
MQPLHCDIFSYFYQELRLMTLFLRAISPRPFFYPRHIAAATRWVCITLIALIACTPANNGHAQDAKANPEHATGHTQHKVIKTQHAMAITANPHATQAAYAMLQKGGSATDAAIAALLVLNVVEPQSSGIGGGAFWVEYNHAQRNTTTLDGRETAPSAITPDMFMATQETPMAFYDAVVGGKAVGTPGLVALMAKAHAQSGLLPWGDLFQPAIDHASYGFPVSPRLHSLLAKDKFLKNNPDAALLFYPNGRPIAVGETLKNPALAQTLRTLATDGADAFYRGAIAHAIVAAVRAHPTNPGYLDLTDLANYTVKTRPALCADIAKHTLCGMAPPSSGPATILQMLKIADAAGITRAKDSAARTHILLQAGKLAFADRNTYMADPDYVAQPIPELLDPAYIKQRAKHISKSAATNATAQAGQLPHHPRYSQGLEPERPSTSHVSIVDKFGNAVSVTASIENGFGSRVMAAGFLLNNQLTDFSFRPITQHGAVANAPAPGKRPRSSMAPMIGFNAQGQLAIVAGSPGGSNIIWYMAQTLAHMLWQGMPPQQAINAPHFALRGDTAYVEDTMPEKHRAALAAFGYTITPRALTSGLHVIQKHNNGWISGVDPRREGLALGE